MKLGKEKLFTLFERYSLRNSINRKYAFGYFLIFLMMLIVFVVSFTCNTFMGKKYDAALDDLLHLNELFTEVEATNRYLYDCLIYFRPASLENNIQSNESVKTALDVVWVQLEQDYSREVMDLCCMVNTYLEQNAALTRTLSAYQMGESFENNLAVQKFYKESQSTIGYINQSFKEIYSIKLISTKSLQALMQRLRMIINAAIVMTILISLVIFFLFYNKVVDGLTRSVKKLTDFASNMTKDPMAKEHVTVKTGDELEVFANCFNNMVDTIQIQFRQIQKDQRIREQLQKAEIENMRISSALQNSQLRLLQSRVNPHFLFNTLNMISKTAYIENAEETSRLIEATAEYLRYNLGKITKSVTLGDEINNIHKYLFIQQCRFGKRIEFVFKVDSACEGQDVPCMIIQPIVENAIKYGVGMMISGGKIIIHIYRENNRCCIDVEDNGRGIPPEDMMELREAIAKKECFSEHIGLRNVYLRLMMYFNDDIDFDITSKPGCTCIHIGLPWRI